MVLSDGTALAALCWDEYAFLEYDTAGQLIVCVFWGLPGSTGTTSISGDLELTTNAWDVFTPNDPAMVMVMAAYGYTLATYPFETPIPMTEGAVALLAWRVPTGFSSDVAVLIPSNPSGGAFWVPQMYRAPLSS